MQKIVLLLFLIFHLKQLNAQTSQFEKAKKIAETFISFYNSDSLEKTLPLFKVPQENEIIRETLFPKLIRLKKAYGKIKDFKYEVYANVRTLQCLLENKSWISLDIDRHYKIQSVKFTGADHQTVYTFYTHIEIKNSIVKPTETLILYKGKKNSNSSASGSGDGEGNPPGNQGDPNGDPLAPFYGDGGSVFGNKPLPLSNFRNLVKPEDDGRETGTIIVKINVNRQGKIVSAIAEARGTTLRNQTLFRECENAILKASLNVISKGPEIRTFYTQFRFTAK